MSDENLSPVYGPFFGAMGASSAMILCATGTAYATAKAGAAIATAATRNPKAIMKTLLPVVMAGIISIYGLVAAVLIVNSIESSDKKYTAFTGYIHFGSGVSVGMTGLVAGYAIGKAGAAGILTTVIEEKFFMGMILILIFAEVLGLYGLIIGLILVTK